MLYKISRRDQVLMFFGQFRPCVFAIEACGGAHFRGREIGKPGHEVRLIIGANSVIIKRHVYAAASPGTWLGGMLTRKLPMLVRVAMADKMTRIV